jgi:hypothetical protein
MGVNESTVLEITCDNPECPGTTLPTDDRTGWVFISSEIYGEPTKQTVFCSYACVSAVTGAAATEPKTGVFASEKVSEEIVEETT